MNILVINCGSSSLKYQLFDMKDERVIVKGLVERIGISGSKLTQGSPCDKYVIEKDLDNHEQAMQLVFSALLDKDRGVISDLKEIDAIGHRVLHGGDKLTSSTIIDDYVKDVIREFIKFGPLHNPANLMGIEACEKIVPGKINVAVFDTAFHQTMPAVSYMYGIPYEYYEKYKIRKFGFHGTSHKYVMLKTAELLGKKPEELNIITAHLGNGSSLAAIKKGKCYTTSMGLTPLEGLIMGTRCGDLDPTIMTFIMDEEGISADQMNKILNKKSGVLGISGLSSDFRDLEEAAAQGDERAELALQMFVSRCKRYMGSYMLTLGKVDCISFTGGLGENSPEAREAILKNLEEYGIIIDPERNRVRGKDAQISTDDSRIKVMVVPTNEELMIARDTLELIK